MKLYMAFYGLCVLTTSCTKEFRLPRISINAVSTLPAFVSPRVYDVWEWFPIWQQLDVFLQVDAYASYNDVAVLV